eukprot:TRINITY_DN9519_c0_g1_i2.p1 TRINITY_DN9519_c0_g1~~TRINITY_DN9519_c0_g1_i2.p1  ORF type:complete len:347 (-),score=17.95 TRINITY_DN9519_c0_g1_i2:35-1075(-)
MTGCQFDAQCIFEDLAVLSAVAVNTASLRMTNSTLRRITAPSDIVSFSNSVVQIENCTISNNNNRIYATSGSRFTVLDTSFTENSAGTHLGPLQCQGCAEFLVSGCNFVRNIDHDHGGAIVIQAPSGPSTIRCSTFEENAAYISGGAISIFADYSDHEIEIINNFFKGNRISSRSNAIFAEFCRVRILGNIIMGGIQFAYAIAITLDSNYFQPDQSDPAIACWGDHDTLSAGGLSNNTFACRSTADVECWFGDNCGICDDGTYNVGSSKPCPVEPLNNCGLCSNFSCGYNPVFPLPATTNSLTTSADFVPSTTTDESSTPQDSSAEQRPVVCGVLVTVLAATQEVD